MSLLDTITVPTASVRASCCGCRFLMDRTMYEQLRESHATWWCPRCGDRQYFPSQSDKERAEAAARRAQELLDSERRENQRLREARDSLDRRLSAQRGATNRLKNRMKNGVCPCCTRSFANLAAHMRTKHPQFAAPAEEHR